MEHADFVSKYRAGFMYDDNFLMPRSLRTKQAVIRTIAFGGLLLAIVLYFFTPWWIATMVLFISWCMFPLAQSQAASGVLKAALEHSYIYKVAVDKNVLRIEEN